MRHDPTAAQKRFWSHLVAMGCVVRFCEKPPQICHVAGKPSITERTHDPKPKGLKIRRHHWLAIPCCEFHHLISPNALDRNPEAFERLYGTCAGHIDRIGKKLGLDLFTLSQEGRKV